jgi:glutamyl-tRNA synthetase
VTVSRPRTRFAPSPTGDLHLGGAWTALASWFWARRAGGDFFLRIEDLDPARSDPRFEKSIQEDLRWLGFDWNGETTRQSQRGSFYEDAIASLARQGLVYPCDCSRAEIARSVGAPHAGDEIVYLGVCRLRDPNRPMKRPAALRAIVPAGVVEYRDGALGAVAQELDREVGDFVLRRGDGAFAYQLAVVVDDLATEITDVIRGADLVSSTPRQIWLARALGESPPRYAHVPLVVAHDGARLEKRTRGVSIRELRAAGISAPAIVGELAYGLGIAGSNAPVTPSDLARAAGPEPVFGTRPWPVPERWVGSAAAADGDDLG